jgi:hypothetical protein
VHFNRIILFFLVAIAILLNCCSQSVSNKNESNEFEQLRLSLNGNALKVKYKFIKTDSTYLFYPLINSSHFNRLISKLVASDLKNKQCDEQLDIQLNYEIVCVTNSFISLFKTVNVRCENSPSDSRWTESLMFWNKNDTLYEVKLSGTSLLDSLVRSELELKVEVDCLQEQYKKGDLILTPNKLIVSDLFTSEVCDRKFYFPFSKKYFSIETLTPVK